ncbi:hypothetical protein FB567DRAFT_541125 [Paraphoma chrysanthemicola]|uniref:Secreted protein n=1 Tax=Paraphoma chrysanthemicola TaxID=798071 RepID=A0A8K0VS93_9PLEO|nr:hypothetical protein FB567DRAFT_541125 [Paraphoma chrysanthemicola]
MGGVTLLGLLSSRVLCACTARTSIEQLRSPENDVYAAFRFSKSSTRWLFLEFCGYFVVIGSCRCVQIAWAVENHALSCIRE